MGKFSVQMLGLIHVELGEPGTQRLEQARISLIRIMMETAISMRRLPLDFVSESSTGPFKDNSLI